MFFSKMNCKKIATLPLFTVLAVLVACGNQAPSTSARQAEVKTSDVIVGDLDWRETANLSSKNPIKKSAKPVGELILPAMQSRCTTFLITENVIMTNRHCVPDASKAIGATASFNHEAGITQESRISYKCDHFLGNDETLDFALLECQGNPGDKFGTVELSNTDAGVGDSIYVVQQNCDYYTDGKCDWTKKYASGKLTDEMQNGEFKHDADTLGGSSGSPVFSIKTNEVIAIHHAGKPTMFGTGRGTENYAVPMSKILPELRKSYPSLRL